MTQTSPEAGSDGPPSSRTVQVRTRALILLAVLTAVCSVALLVGLNSPKAAPAAVVRTALSADVTQAAAYAATSANTVEIKNYAYAPAAVTVPLGTTVTWVNEDTVPHTVTGKSGPASFDSGQIAAGGSWSATFATAGTYGYYCVDHPQMVAQITVTSSPGGGPTTTPSTAPTTAPSSTPPTTHPTTPPTTHPTSASSPPPTTPGGSGSPSTTPTTPAGSTTPSTSPTGSPSSPAASSPSSSMSMPGPSTGGQCGLNQVLSTLVQHVDSAHLGESPGQQVQDLMNLDQYVLTHTTLVANMLTPAEGLLTGSC